MTYDIPLPFSQKPRYPNRCVVCERENPETTAELVVLVSIRTRTISSEIAETVLFGASNSSQNQHVRLCPPACLRCSRLVTRHGWYALIGQYAYPLAWSRLCCSSHGVRILLVEYDRVVFRCTVAGNKKHYMATRDRCDGRWYKSRL